MTDYAFHYITTKGKGGDSPERYHQDYHVHLLVKEGEMRFSDGRSWFRSRKNDLVIWQMSFNLQNVSYSEDFEADYFITSPGFVMTNNPVMTWATKSFIFIRMNPSLHLEGKALERMIHEFETLRDRERAEDDMFRLDILGKLFSIFLYDLWTIYYKSLSGLQGNDNNSQIFLRFVGLVQRDCKQDRLVAHYADLLCITPKYLNQVCNKVTNISASEWISYYTNFELIRLLDNPMKTFADIAFEMNFSSNSFFTRYTKKHLGMTPTEYRNRKMLPAEGN